MLDKAMDVAVNPGMPAEYRHNKAKTFLDMVRRIENWPTAAGMRLNRKRAGLRMLRFRDGLNVVCRAGTRDWDVIHELLFAGSYERAMEWLRKCPQSPIVIDLGGNIGLFSLIASRQREDITVHAYEPGPPNFHLFEMNLLANPALGARIQLHREAVGGADATVDWFFDESNPGGSSLYGTRGQSFPVRIRAFSNVLAELGSRIALAKIDIEGAEFDLLRETPESAWKMIDAVSLELHHDPTGAMTQDMFFKRMESLGYSITEESVCSYFLCRH
jgi:FkbM family methyltransferase